MEACQDECDAIGAECTAYTYIPESAGTEMINCFLKTMDHECVMPTDAREDPTRITALKCAEGGLDAPLGEAAAGAPAGAPGAALDPTADAPTGVVTPGGDGAADSTAGVTGEAATEPVDTVGNRDIAAPAPGGVTNDPNSAGSLCASVAAVAAAAAVALM